MDAPRALVVYHGLPARLAHLLVLIQVEDLARGDGLHDTSATAAGQIASAGSLPAIWIRPLLNRPACDFSALASVSNHSASSAKPSSRAVLAMPGYIWVYSYVSPATADFRFSSVLPMASPVAGSPTSLRKSRCPKACPVSASAVSLNSPATSGKP